MGAFDEKKVSVIVPNYNYGRYLKRRVKSILRQTYPIFELILLDDSSTDGSQEVILEIQRMVKARYPQVQVKTILNEKNTGQPIRQWLKGVEEARGDYVWIAEADDSSNKSFLSEVMKGFDDSEVAISYAESRVINGVGVMILPNFRRSRDKEGTGHFNKSYVKRGVEEIKEIMAVRCTVPNVSGVVFKKTPELIKNLSEALKFGQVGDWYLYAKLIENGKIAYNRRSLNYFCIHGGSATKRGKEHLDEVKWMHDYFRKNYELSNEVLERMDREVERIRAKYGIIE